MESSTYWPISYGAPFTHTPNQQRLHSAASFRAEHLTIDYSTVSEQQIVLIDPQVKSLTVTAQTTGVGVAGAIRTSLALLDASGCKALETINCTLTNGEQLALALPSNAPKLAAVNLYMVTMDPAQADAYLAAVDASGALNGAIYVFALPTGAGMASIASLQGKGWTALFD